MFFRLISLLSEATYRSPPQNSGPHRKYNDYDNTGQSAGFKRPPSDIASMTSIKVGNLNYRTTAEDLQNTFSKFGEIGDVFIPQGDRGSKGFGFVR